MTDRRKIEEQARQLTIELASKGKLIEGGFAALVLIMFPNATSAQRRDLRLAYMAGAEHLFTSIVGIMDPGEEPTTADLSRMDLIHAELQAWRTEMEGRRPRT
jgi:hypothetical protein